MQSTAAGAFKLRVLRGDACDVLGDQMGDGLKTSINGSDLEVPPLQPGARTIIEVPWTSQNGPGTYWLKLELLGTDANAKNNVLNIHRKLE